MKKETYKSPQIFPGKKVSYCKKRKLPRVLLSLFLVVALLMGGGFWYFSKILSYEHLELEKKPEILGFEEVKDGRILNIALFGVDTRTVDSFSGRSDTIMILSVNTKTNKVKLISVLRDSFMPIEENGEICYGKINSAYASGGAPLAIKTLNTVFDLDISEYVSINFFRLADIIDLVGGIEVEITEEEISLINAGVNEICYVAGIKNDVEPITESGVQHLNGKQAVGYARIRYTPSLQGANNDFGRTDRQRLIMEKLFKKVLSMKKTDVLKLVKPILKCCQTSLSYGEIADVVIDIFSNNSKFEEVRMPQTKYLMNSPQTSAGSVVYYDLNYAAKVINYFIYKDISPQKFEETYGIEKNDWYLNGYTPPKIEVDKN